MTVRSWWARSLVATLEEASYGEADLRRGRRLARAGEVGEITVAGGETVAAVIDGDDAWSVRVGVPVLDDVERDTLVELVAAGSGWLGALLGGGLPEPFLEAVDEAGVELAPYAGDLECRCGCDAWASPCAHALALLTQLSWLVDTDPLVLTAWRGLGREELLAALAVLGGGGAGGTPAGGPDDEDLDVAQEAAERAARVLAAMKNPDGDVDRWF
ncbi:MAG: SWIM zinc finger family protein [Nocardioides sp.]|uniref:SWIM zinc finger family protein n=1 Tax=Nocardioides sp. TaxID=35761 RepID=UPI003F06CD31